MFSGRHLVKYGLTLLGSRAFASSQVATHIMRDGHRITSLHDPDMLLYPGVDSLNHNPLTKNRWFSDDKVLGIVVEDEVTAGMEIWNPYGGKGNGECEFLSYFLVVRIRVGRVKMCTWPRANRCQCYCRMAFVWRIILAIHSR